MAESRVAQIEFANTWNDSESVAEVAAIYGITRNAASARAIYLRKRGHRLKYMRNTDGAAARQEFAKIWNAAKSLDDVIVATGKSPGAARSYASILRKRGYDLKRMGRKKIDRDAYAAAWNSAASLSEAAEKFGQSKAAAMSMAARLREEGFNLKSFQRWATFDYASFVDAWNADISLSGVADSCGCTIEEAIKKSRRARALGHDLRKRIPGQWKPVALPEGELGRMRIRSDGYEIEISPGITIRISWAAAARGEAVQSVLERDIRSLLPQTLKKWAY